MSCAMKTPLITIGDGLSLEIHRCVDCGYAPDVYGEAELVAFVDAGNLVRIEPFGIQPVDDAVHRVENAGFESRGIRCLSWRFLGVHREAVRIDRSPVRAFSPGVTGLLPDADKVNLLRGEGQWIAIGGDCHSPLDCRLSRQRNVFQTLGRGIGALAGLGDFFQRVFDCLGDRSVCCFLQSFLQVWLGRPDQSSALPF